MATAKKKTVKLNKNATAWVKALRSGKYKQTIGQLTEVNPETGEIVGHCCLGVACELALKAGVPLKTETQNYYVRYNKESSLILPTMVQKWLGLSCLNGQFGDDGKSLASENDTGKSFKQIARIIEQNAKELFYD
jgi:hypothetical protein